MTLSAPRGEDSYMSALTILTVLAQSTSDDGITLREIVSQLPSDPASVFTILFLLGSLGLVLWFGGRSGGGGHHPEGAAPVGGQLTRFRSETGAFRSLALQLAGLHIIFRIRAPHQRPGKT